MTFGSAAVTADVTVTASTDSAECVEDGLQAIHLDNEIGTDVRELEEPVHELNCFLVVPLEDFVDETVFALLGALGGNGG